MKDILEFLKSEYLVQFWWLLGAGYLLVYGVAHLVSRTGRKDNTTIVYRCRQAWGIAFLLHALASIGIMVNWYLQNGMFASFWKFFPFYLALGILDFCLVLGLFASLRFYITYHTNK